MHHVQNNFPYRIVQVMDLREGALTFRAGTPALPPAPAMPTDSAGRGVPAGAGAAAPGPPPNAEAFSLYAG